MIIKRQVMLALIMTLLLGLLIGCDSEEPSTAETTTATLKEPTKGAITAPVQPTAAAAGGIEVALDQIQRFDGEILARVNDEAIWWEDYEPILNQTLRTLGSQYQLRWEDPAMQERLEHLQQNVLEDVVDRRLMAQMAADEGIAVSDAEVDAAVEQEKSNALSQEGVSSWKAFLEANGFTEKSFHRFMRDQLLYDKLLQSQDIETLEEQVHLLYIVVSDQASAQTVASELESGRRFQDVAAQYSEDPNSKDNGGDLGWFAIDLLPPEITQVVNSLEVGSHSEVIETSSGFVVIQVLAREMREAAAEQLLQERMASVISQLDSKRAEAAIEYLVSFGSD